MTKTVSHPEEIITEFRQVLPAKSATAHAIDRQEPWERTAQDAVDDGSTEFDDGSTEFDDGSTGFDDELDRLIEDYVRRGAG